MKLKNCDHYGKLATLVPFFFYTLLVMLFCAGSSPVIDRMFTDSSVFFAMGRGMRAGKVVYRDLFDHKGWYLYFINYLGALISESTSIGIWFVEVCFAFADVLLCFKIARVYFADNDAKCICVSQLMLLLIVNYFTYEGGNTVEFYCLTFQFVSVLLFVLYERSGVVPHPPFYMLVHGLCVGISFGLRGNMVLAWGALAAVLIIRLFICHEYKNMIDNILYGLSGIIIALLPLFLYGVLTESLLDMYEQSFRFNLLYGSSTIIQNIIPAVFSRNGILTSIACLASCIAVKKSKKVSSTGQLVFFLAWVLSILSFSISGYTFPHYYEYVIPLTIPFAMFMTEIISGIIEQHRISRRAVCVIIAALTICCNMRLPIKLFFDSESNRYAKTVETVTDLYRELYRDDKKVIVKGNNAIFYNKMDVIPSNKYFYLPEISYNDYPYAVDSQIESILSEENDVIIVPFPNKEYHDERIIYDDERDDQINALLDNKYRTVYDNGLVRMWIKRC